VKMKYLTKQTLPSAEHFDITANLTNKPMNENKRKMNTQPDDGYFMKRFCKVGNVTKEQTNNQKPKRIVNTANDDEKDYSHQQLVDSECNDMKKILNEQKQDSTPRCERNSPRSKEIRIRKTFMVEEMQKQITLLTLKNKRLRLESQNQETEINQLRNACQLLASEQKHFAHTGASKASPASKSDSDILKIIDRIIDNTNADTALLRTPRQQEHITGYEDVLQPSAPPFSIVRLANLILENNLNHFGIQK